MLDAGPHPFHPSLAAQEAGALCRHWCRQAPATDSKKQGLGAILISNLLEATPGIEPGIAVLQFPHGRDGWCCLVLPGAVLNSNRHLIGPSGDVPCRPILASPCAKCEQAARHNPEDVPTARPPGKRLSRRWLGVAPDGGTRW